MRVAARHDLPRLGLASSVGGVAGALSRAPSGRGVKCGLGATGRGRCPLPVGMSGFAGLPPPTCTICHLCCPRPLHCHDGAAYIVVRVADSLYVSFPEALPAPPLYSRLTLMGMDEWPDTAPLDGVDDAASDSGASSHNDAPSHNDDLLE